MKMTLSNDDAAEAAALPARRPVHRAVTAAIESLGTLDPPGRARAQVALALASKLDQAAASKTGAIALATSSLSRELTRVLDSLVDPGRETAAAELIARIFEQ